MLISRRSSVEVFTRLPVEGRGRRARNVDWQDEGFAAEAEPLDNEFPEGEAVHMPVRMFEQPRGRIRTGFVPLAHNPKRYPRDILGQGRNAGVDPSALL